MPGTELALLLIDLDNFKRINDEYGHLAGDEVLRAVAEEVSRVAHPCDLPARLGGDEFALLAQLPEPGDAVALAARIVEAVGELRFTMPLESLRVSVSVGVSRCSDETDWSSWYSQADAALYRAKGEGGGTWTLHA